MMFKKIKELFYRWKSRNAAPQGEVYVILRRAKTNTNEVIVIDSVHSTLKSAAIKHSKLPDYFKNDYQIERYALWS